jgi:hypothetical protein
LKRIELKKVWKKKKKKKTYLAYLSAQQAHQPAIPVPRNGPRRHFPFSFSSPADAPAPPVSGFPFTFLLSPLLCFARSGAAAIPAAPGLLPSPSYSPKPAN